MSFTANIRNTWKWYPESMFARQGNTWYRSLAGIEFTKHVYICCCYSCFDFSGLLRTNKLACFSQRRYYGWKVSRESHVWLSTGKGTWSGYGARPRGKGIVDQCCRPAGCELQHLEMYCAKPKSQQHTTAYPITTTASQTTTQLDMVRALLLEYEIAFFTYSIVRHDCLN